jgi:hypothetical protein
MVVSKQVFAKPMLGISSGKGISVRELENFPGAAAKTL